MKMKHHILSALREEFDQWEDLLGGLSETQRAAPLLPAHWSVKDILAHLMAWQSRSIARTEAARLNREPEFPRWPAELDPNSEGDTERINAWIYEAHRSQPWSAVYQDWQHGFLRFLESAGGVPEREMLDSERYPWLNGHPLSFILTASYDHHQEHFEKLQAWLKEHGKG
jgi:hypothetical protein